MRRDGCLRPKSCSGHLKEDYLHIGRDEYLSYWLDIGSIVTHVFGLTKLDRHQL